MVFSSIPWPIPIVIATIIKAINAFNLKTMIKRKRRSIPSEIIINGMVKN
jgi:hypothetical protein